VSEPSDRDAVSYFNAHATHYQDNQYRSARRTFINVRHQLLLQLIDGLGLPPGTPVLDAGCGPGPLTVEFARRGFAVTALDASTSMLALARENVDRAGFGGAVRFEEGSIERLPFESGAFAMVCSSGVIEYLQSYTTALAEFARVLRPGGHLVLPTTNVLAPAYFLRPVVEPLGRIPLAARLLGIKPRTFRVYLHYLPLFRKRLERAGFAIDDGRHFYLTPPRPLDRVFTRVSIALDRHLAARPRTPLRHCAEGYVAVCRKASTAADRP
jgi:ubiquinone/menaquinone biosynthesis C-methylase UbiE